MQTDRGLSCPQITYVPFRRVAFNYDAGNPSCNIYIIYNPVTTINIFVIFFILNPCHAE